MKGLFYKLQRYFFSRFPTSSLRRKLLTTSCLPFCRKNLFVFDFFWLIFRCFCAEACLVGWDLGHGNRHFVLYGVTLDALCFDITEFGSSIKVVKGKAAVDVHWVCIGTPVMGVSICISTWASALLVLTTWACQSLVMWDGWKENSPHRFIFIVFTCLNSGALQGKTNTQMAMWLGTWAMPAALPRAAACRTVTATRRRTLMAA